MPSSVAVILDTTPPALTFGRARLDGPNVRIPFASSEPAAITATIGGTLAIVEPGALIATGAPREGELHVLAFDEVLNRRELTLPYSVGLAARAGRIVTSAAGAIAGAITGRLTGARRGRA